MNFNIQSKIEPKLVGSIKQVDYAEYIRESCFGKHWDICPATPEGIICKGFLSKAINAGWWIESKSNKKVIAHIQKRDGDINAMDLLYDRIIDAGLTVEQFFVGSDVIPAPSKPKWRGLLPDSTDELFKQLRLWNEEKIIELLKSDKTNVITAYMHKYTGVPIYVSISHVEYTIQLKLQKNYRLIGKIGNNKLDDVEVTDLHAQLDAWYKEIDHLLFNIALVAPASILMYGDHEMCDKTMEKFTDEEREEILKYIGILH